MAAIGNDLVREDLITNADALVSSFHRLPRFRYDVELCARDERGIFSDDPPAPNVSPLTAAASASDPVLQG